MSDKLSHAELNLLITSLEYAKRNIVDAPETPLEVRNQNLAEVETLSAKLRKIKHAYQS
jgi:hypothetical protein